MKKKSFLCIFAASLVLSACNSGGSSTPAKPLYMPAGNYTLNLAASNNCTSNIANGAFTYPVKSESAVIGTNGQLTNFSSNSSPAITVNQNPCFNGTITNTLVTNTTTITFYQCNYSTTTNTLTINNVTILQTDPNNIGNSNQYVRCVTTGTLIPSLGSNENLTISKDANFSFSKNLVDSIQIKK